LISKEYKFFHEFKFNSRAPHGALESSRLPSPPGGGFYNEHDNRVAPDYDQYGDEYAGSDYTRNKRPAGHNQYKFDHRFNTPTLSHNAKGGMDAPYRNGNGSSYPSGHSNNNGNTSQFGATAAQMFNNLNKMVAQVAPIIQSQLGGNMMGAGIFQGNSNTMGNDANFAQFKQNNNNNNNNGIMNNFGMNQTNMDMNHFETQTQPQMMSYKQFLFSITSGNQSAKMTPEQSNKLYNEYKIKFRREQTALFFAAHKNEEWFKLRYHPNDSTKRKEEQRETTKRRLDIFMELIESTLASSENNVPPLSLEMTNDLNKKRLFKFLDAVMIRLEGGTSQELDILETIYEEAREENETETKLKENVKEESDDEAGVKKTSEKDTNGDELKSSNEAESNTLENEKTNGEKSETTIKSEKKDEEKKSTNNTLTKKSTPPTIPQKTQSIFFKHLPVNVTRSDLEKVNFLIRKNCFYKICNF
jgi:hypothetical protein